MGEMGRKRWLDDLYGKLLRLHLHYIWPRRKPYGLIARARGKSLPGPAHGLEPAAQQLRPLDRSGVVQRLSIMAPMKTKTNPVYPANRHQKEIHVGTI